MPGSLRSPGGAQDPAAFPPGGGGQPAGQRGRVADPVQLVHQPQPDVLADVVGVGGSSRCLRQIDQISGAYRSTSASHACMSPFAARVTRSVTG